MRLFRGGWDWLADDPHHLRGARYLQVALGLMMLFRVLTEGRFAAYLWGPSGLGWGSTEYIVGPALGPLLDLAFATEFRTVSVLVALAAGALGLVAGYRTRASTALALVALFLLEQRLPELPDGGDNITRLVLIYMLFLLPAGAKPERRSLSVWLHNVAVLAIAVQVVVLYATSGLMKAYGERWHHGTALYYVSQVEWFSLPGAREIFKNSLVVTTASYGSVLWEVLFPLAMISPLKLLWLSLGIAFHVSIAGFMGLITFSTAMIGLELFLITDPEYERIFENLGRFRERLRGLVRGKSATAPRLRLFVDGSCPDCRAAGAFIERVDLNHHIEVVSFRQDDSYSKYGIAPANVERRMHLVNLGDGSVLSGFDSLRALASHIPWLWLTRPLLGLTAALGFGDSLYDFLAARRRILPDAGACRAECHARAHGCRPRREELMGGARMQGVWFAYEPGRPVLAGIDLNAPQGTILGLLGANGAGKTTTFRLLAGLLRPDAGEIEVDGVSVIANPREAKRRCAYVPEETLLYPFLSALENLNMFALLWGVPGNVAQSRAEALLRQVDLWPVRHQWVRTYSRGMRQKLSLCAALLHDPCVLLMDEPFAGLDIAAAMWARELLRQFAGSGRSIVLTSHTPEIIEALADPVVILHGGRVAYENSQAGLRNDGGAVAVFERVRANWRHNVLS